MQLKVPPRVQGSVADKGRRAGWFLAPLRIVGRGRGHFTCRDDGLGGP
jgi:hypothetical protein